MVTPSIAPAILSTAMRSSLEANASDSKVERFEALVDRAERGKLDFDQLRELARLYRVHSARLSLLRTRSTDPEAIRYYNALCLRAYTHVHVATPDGASARGRGVLFLRDIPAALGRTWRLQLLASALLFAGALIGAQIVLEDPAGLGAVVPAAMYPEPELHRLYHVEAARRAFLAPRDESFTIDTVFAGMLFANNTRVGLLSLAVGVLGALPTVLLLLYNGLTLGGFAVIFMRGPERVDFLAWIVPHAIPELLAIVLCASGGLAMGLAVIAPGRAGRPAALRRAAGDALLLLTASLPLLVAAALIESFVRQSLLGVGARFAVAASALIALLAYVWLVRRLAARARPIDLGFLAAQITTDPPPGSAGSARAADR
jgi:uncharacterized membrane protein SpoIIM required for sporulation